MVQERVNLEKELQNQQTTRTTWLEPVNFMILTSRKAAELCKLPVKDSQLRRFFENLGSNPILSFRTIDLGLPEFWKTVVESGFFGTEAKPAPTSDDEFSQVFQMLAHFLDKARTSRAGYIANRGHRETRTQRSVRRQFCEERAQISNQTNFGTLSKTAVRPGFELSVKGERA